MKVATWNTEWRPSDTRDAGIIRARLAEIDPDIVCLTETHLDFLSSWDGFSVCSTDDWGGETYGTRREVLLWSKRPWQDVEAIGSPRLPRGRFVRGRTMSPIGVLTVVGVVIPYHMSNVRHGTRDKALWELHRTYLDGLPEAVSSLGPNSIVTGDFNQRIPSNWVPQQLQSKLLTALDQFKIVTTAKLDPICKHAIDHIAIGENLSAQGVSSISNLYEGRQISDHFGVFADIVPNTATSAAVVEPTNLSLS